jgi:chromate transporter
MKHARVVPGLVAFIGNEVEHLLDRPIDDDLALDVHHAPPSLPRGGLRATSALETLVTEQDCQPPGDVARERQPGHPKDAEGDGTESSNEPRAATAFEILALAALFLGSPPAWVRGLGAGAGAVVAAVAVRAGIDLIGPSRARAAHPRRWTVYVLIGAAATALIGPWLVLALLACGAAELLRQRVLGTRTTLMINPTGPIAVLAVTAASGGLAALAWTAFKVGALSYGGGFVIIPLMQADAVDHFHWMTDGQFLNAVALGQATPGPVVQTVAVVGYAAAGLGGPLLAAVVAFAPSFWFILLGADRFERFRTDARASAFLAGAGPAAIGAILGSSIPLALALTETWQVAILAAGALLLFVARRGVLTTLLTAGAAGVALALAGAPLPT